MSVITSAKYAIKPAATVLSGIQPTGVFHLGNYLGAVQNWAQIAHDAPPDAKIFLSVVDLHALTLPKNPQDLRKWKLQSIASIVASGIDPYRVSLFYQSDVPQHSELCWLLSTVTSMGYLNRMTQWKSKASLRDDADISSSSALENLQLGLFAYPVLQAADVLLYNADYVPVGEDQAQHLELTRQIAKSFNSTYPYKGKPFFKMPVTLLTPTKRVSSLRDAHKKMSKSDPNQNSCIYVTDEPDVISAKLRSAVTDSIQGPITYDIDQRPGVSNLLDICAGLLGSTSPQELLDSGTINATNHKLFKDSVTEILTEKLRPVREEYQRIVREPDFLVKVAKHGAENAREVAEKNLACVHEAMGIKMGV